MPASTFVADLRLARTGDFEALLRTARTLKITTVSELVARVWPASVPPSVAAFDAAADAIDVIRSLDQPAV